MPPLSPPFAPLDAPDVSNNLAVAAANDSIRLLVTLMATTLLFFCCCLCLFGCMRKKKDEENKRFLEVGTMHALGAPPEKGATDGADATASGGINHSGIVIVEGGMGEAGRQPASMRPPPRPSRFGAGQSQQRGLVAQDTAYFGSHHQLVATNI